MPKELSQADFLDNWHGILLNRAENARLKAYFLGKTSVGAALLAEDLSIHAGCNINHRFRCDDIHAEKNAIGHMIMAGKTKILALVIASNREKFTPCGTCMDWIFQFGTEGTFISYVNIDSGQSSLLLAKDIMPHYPSY